MRIYTCRYNLQTGELSESYEDYKVCPVIYKAFLDDDTIHADSALSRSDAFKKVLEEATQLSKLMGQATYRLFDEWCQRGNI